MILDVRRQDRLEQNLVDPLGLKTIRILFPGFPEINEQRHGGYLLMLARACLISFLRATKATALYPHKSEKLAEDFFIILPRRNIQYSRLHYVANSDRVLEWGKNGGGGGGGGDGGDGGGERGMADRKKLKRMKKGGKYAADRICMPITPRTTRLSG